MNYEIFYTLFKHFSYLKKDIYLYRLLVTETLGDLFCVNDYFMPLMREKSISTRNNIICYTYRVANVNAIN
jgi:hypothetical protein